MTAQLSYAVERLLKCQYVPLLESDKSLGPKSVCFHHTLWRSRRTCSVCVDVDQDRSSRQEVGNTAPSDLAHFIESRQSAEVRSCYSFGSSADPVETQLEVRTCAALLTNKSKNQFVRIEHDRVFF